MYDDVQYLGETLKAWSEKLGNQFTPGELYRMMKAGQSIPGETDPGSAHNSTR